MHRRASDGRGDPDSDRGKDEKNLRACPRPSGVLDQQEETW